MALPPIPSGNSAGVNQQEECPFKRRRLSRHSRIIALLVRLQTASRLQTGPAGPGAR
jgi:hypothetical protein